MLHNVSIIIIIVVTGIDYITFYYNHIATFHSVQCSYNSRFCKIHAKFPYSERYTVFLDACKYSDIILLYLLQSLRFQYL